MDSQNGDILWSVPVQPSLGASENDLNFGDFQDVLRPEPTIDSVNQLTIDTSVLIPNKNRKKDDFEQLVSVFYDVSSYLSIQDLCRLAQVCKAAKAAVYDKGRWCQYMKNMNAWDTIKSRRIDKEKRKSKELQISENQKRQQQQIKEQKLREEQKINGIEKPVTNLLDFTTTPPSTSAPNFTSTTSPTTIFSKSDLISPLQIFDSINYDRDLAHSQFALIYKTLHHYYKNLVTSSSYSEPYIFRMFRDPEDQAAILNIIQRFSEVDPLESHHEDNIDRLNSIIDVFENAALREVELAYDDHDFAGKARRYVKVLILLNGGESCKLLFLQKQPITDEILGDFEDCFSNSNINNSNGNGYNYNDRLNLKVLNSNLSKIAILLNEQSEIIDIVFPPTTPIMFPLCEHIFEDVIMEYISEIIKQTRIRDPSLQMYLDAVPGIYKEFLRFIRQLKKSENIGPTYHEIILDLIDMYFEASIESYLHQEVSNLRSSIEGRVSQWDKQVIEQEKSVETTILNNVTKQDDKTDLLASFRKAFRIPVNIGIGNLSITDNNNSGNNNNNSNSTVDLQSASSNTTTPVSPQTSDTIAINKTGSSSPFTNGHGRLSHVATGSIASSISLTEFEAKTAIMNKKLEGIKNLFSLELSLTIIKIAKESIERLRTFVRVHGEMSKLAKEECENVFVILVETVGGHHIKYGFDKALGRLTDYNPREFRNNEKSNDDNKDDTLNLIEPSTPTANTSPPPLQPSISVEPLVTFAELVNIGDLIQQMLHIFFQEELVSKKYINANDFLTPSVKAKKRFEVMLDDCVANGLNRGIEVLIDEIDYIFQTTQVPTDYNPELLAIINPESSPNAALDSTGETNCAKRVVYLLENHMSILDGSTEKSVVDIFQQEIGIRFFQSICKNLKRQTISIMGSIRLISDINYYSAFISKIATTGEKKKILTNYFAGLRNLSQIYLISKDDSKAIAELMSDMVRFRGIFSQDDIYEYVQRRADWLSIKKDVEKAMYGFNFSADCVIC